MKQLLFFDIECSNCYEGEGKVCEFGAVLTDENFNIIRQYDIPMSPGKGRGCRFDMGIYKRDPNFDWAYDFDYYFSCDEFPEFYKTIANLVEDKNTIVFGYAVDNDIRYLGSSIKRYGLNQLTYTTYDVKEMIKKYTKAKMQVGGLKGAFENFCGKQSMVNLVPHLSRDDAKMTVMIVKKLCENLEISATELVELCQGCSYNSSEYLEAYVAKKEEKRHHPELFIRRRGGGKPKSECQILWGDTYREHLPLLEKEESIGRIVTISAKLKEDMDVITNTINTIKNNHLVAFDGIAGSDILVAFDEDDKNRLLNMFKHPYNGPIILYRDFVGMSNLA